MTFIGSEVRDPGKTWCARCRRVRGCGRTLCFGEHWLSGGAAVSGNPARATKPRSHSDDGRRFRSARRDVHGRRDHDFHFGCDNGLILVLPENCNHEQISGSRSSTRSTGNLDGPPRFAAHAYN